MKKSNLAIWSAIIALLALNILLFGALIITADPGSRVQYIPDDGFYYLTLSQNFSNLGQWTFDSGVTLTSGFHLLFAYLLAALHTIFNPDLDSFVISGILTGLFFTIASIAVLFYWGFKRKNVLFLMFLALVITSQNFIFNTVSITEWAVGIFVSALYAVWFFTRYRQPVLKNRDFIILFALGLLSSVARSDSGLLPFSIFTAVLLSHLLLKTPRSQLNFSLSGLAGTIAGLILFFAHNLIFAGELLQSSAKMKAYWGQFVEPGYYAAPTLIGRSIGVFGLLLLAVLIAAVLFPRFSSKKDQLPQSPLSEAQKQHFFIMLIAGAICFLGYTLFYSRGGGIQPWYSGNLIVPILIFLFGLTTYLAASLSERAIFLFGFLFAAAAVLNVAPLYPLSAEKAPWPYHQYAYQAGRYLNQNPPDAPIGAWNAGIIGYYEGGRVINLDGLVNQEIYPYAIDNNLPAYLARQNITYIIDFERMITEDLYRQRGGYDDPAFTNRLTHQRIFDPGTYGLILYRVDWEND